MHTPGHLPMVAIGAAAGACVRWAIGEIVVVDAFPWHTLLVNVVGCAAFAAVTARPIPMRVDRLLAAGFCGGLTTFSTFAVEIVDLIDRDKAGIAIIYVTLSLLLGLVAFRAVRHQMAQPPRLESVS